MSAAWSGGSSVVGFTFLPVAGLLESVDHNLLNGWHTRDHGRAVRIRKEVLHQLDKAEENLVKAPDFKATERTTFQKAEDKAVDLGQKTVDKAVELKDKAAAKIEEMKKVEPAKK